jgi:integrase/recombinase XerC
MIEAFLKYLKSEKRYSFHTLLSYENDLIQFRDFLQTEFNEPDSLKAETTMIRSWVVHLLEDGMSPRSVNRKLSSLKSFYRFQKREGSIKTLPTAGVINPKTEKRLPEFVRETEMDKLFEEVDYPEGFPGLRDRLLLELFYACGIRLSELINLTEANVELESGTIKVLGKRNKERLIPLHKNLFPLLRVYLKLKKELYDRPELLLSDKGEKLYPKFVYRKVNHYLGQVTTLQKKSPHILRHTFATHMLNQGADLNTIKELLGHANLSATEVYTHNSIEKLKKVYNQAHPRA